MSSRRRTLGALAILHYAAAILVGSFLLFQVQPMIARFILPWFGGSPAVWTTCLLFFQVALLAGYAYAHSLADRVELRRQALVHVALLAASLAALPIVPSLEWKAAAAAGSHPVLVILSLLAGTIGAPYVLLSSTSPLLQHWFERTRPGRSPYRLFALSNLGSLLGLVAYPFVVEPLLRLRAQANLWSAAYALYAGLCAVCAVEVWRRSRGAGAVVAVREPAPGIVLRDRLVWLLLAATGTLMLMATSNHVVQDVASVPFLWVLPLALYLSTLVLCFENERWAVHRLWLAAYALVLPVTVYMLFHQGTTHLANEIVVYSATLFSGCMAVHGELARSRPPAGRLTSFYLHVAAGGALGGAFVTLVAPILLDGYWEFQLALVATWVLAGVGLVRAMGMSGPPVRRWSPVAWGVGGVALAVALGIQVARARQASTEAERNFYGVLRVVEWWQGDGRLRALYSNWVLHGTEVLSGPWQGRASTYYGEGSGVALAIERHPARQAGHPLHVGVVGLGAGTIAALARPGDRVRFYEINPGVIQMAARRFGYLRASAGAITVVRGDARLSLEGELKRPGPVAFDILAVDAFTGHAIPVHLLTREAFGVYLRHLRPDGILAVHISNRHLDLAPLIRGLSRDAGLAAVLIDNHPPKTPTTIYEHSQWVLLTRNPAFLGDSLVAARADTAFARGRRTIIWTDDYSDLLRVVR